MDKDTILLIVFWGITWPYHEVLARIRSFQKDLRKWPLWTPHIHTIVADYLGSDDGRSRPQSNARVQKSTTTTVIIILFEFYITRYPSHQRDHVRWRWYRRPCHRQWVWNVQRLVYYPEMIQRIKLGRCLLRGLVSTSSIWTSSHRREPSRFKRLFLKDSFMQPVFSGKVWRLPKLVSMWPFKLLYLEEERKTTLSFDRRSPRPRWFQHDSNSSWHARSREEPQ